MLQRSEANNARLLKDFPKAFELDATHRPHITMIQRFVRTADLDNVYAAACKVLAGANVNAMKLEAFKYYYIPSGNTGLTGIVAKPTSELVKLQEDLIAVAPFTVQPDRRSSTAELVRGQLPDGVTLREVGEHRLKGLLGPERLLQVVASDLRADFPPLASQTGHSLPAERDAFVGRDESWPRWHDAWTPARGWSQSWVSAAPARRGWARGSAGARSPTSRAQRKRRGRTALL